MIAQCKREPGRQGEGDAYTRILVDEVCVHLTIEDRGTRNVLEDDVRPTKFLVE